MLILLWHEIQGCLYGSIVPLFGHSNLQRKPHFRNKKYNWGTLPRVREVLLNLAMYQEIGVKPHYCIIDIRLQGYFERTVSLTGTATDQNFITSCRYFLKKHKLPVRNKTLFFFGDIFLVVIFLFPCDIVVICLCPTYRVMMV